ncbi:tRNA pseudouridine(38-40) synthase TruA [Desulfuromonas acetoxidans]|uniref:tRNA pseudouridine synthase A n=1 Tax=Desulfuromonas acetoxidans (strain DSM 684 / 11070) TaxID=281689 RepID=Q1K346_DESA6|nr:tRNA pseudouridine(38-40) synthase TruA [Desulfuromonas acetoxidans]EAT16685.1 tRNA pseudouridine synthase A [Desulfuromonas acetoxidans DSM 684]MBF0644843.1 tRNA pseudouridine(38-40) synthase TruA [Desulfuromonas acetoxidans]NVD23624.1 tRNA pseudouridine(38-40) synthase TruA [Desulfuromonas acetoxidans]NVE15991.1 tRNA pseudouridine(38-40) synthase TruA [Desulfuromonas acetoxidans]
MPRLCLTVEYDGTSYGGWQVQPNAQTVQEQIESALAQVIGASVRVYSSGRTDAGVHAIDMKAHFDVETLLPLSAYREGVNRFLPQDIVVRQVCRVADDFHARFDAQGKWYRYRLYRGRIRSPLHRLTSWHVAGGLDVEAMTQAADALVGTHDFAAFQASGCAAATTQRTLFEVLLIDEGDELIIDVRGSGFLKNMVRIIVGSLVEVGRAKLTAGQLAEILASGQRCRAGLTAPAQGLCLMQVWYEKNIEIT